jgi:hypothetical protein
MEPVISYNLQPSANAKLQSCWYAVYTKPHHEKRIYNQLQQEGIKTYLPLQMTLKQWSDRKKKICKPLFSCYLFANITSKEYYKVLNVSGVEIKAVPLTGATGDLVEYAGKKRVIIHIEEIHKSILVNVSLNFLRLVE